MYGVGGGGEWGGREGMKGGGQGAEQERKVKWLYVGYPAQGSSLLGLASVGVLRPDPIGTNVGGL